MMQVKPTVQKGLDGLYVPGLTVNGQFKAIGPGCVAMSMAIRLANRRFTAIESFVAVCVKPLAG